MSNSKQLYRTLLTLHLHIFIFHALYYNKNLMSHMSIYLRTILLSVFFCFACLHVQAGDSRINTMDICIF